MNITDRLISEDKRAITIQVSITDHTMGVMDRAAMYMAFVNLSERDANSIYSDNKNSKLNMLHYESHTDTHRYEASFDRKGLYSYTHKDLIEDKVEELISLKYRRGL